MRVLAAINRICYGSCLLAIIAGAFLAVYAIWAEEHEVGWKGVATAAVLIFAAVLVLTTNAVIGSKVMNDNGGVGELIGTKPARAGGPTPARAANPLASQIQASRREHAEREGEPRDEG